MKKSLPIYDIKPFTQNDNYFYANNLITHLESHKFVNEPHKHNTYIAIIFTKGNGSHCIDFKHYEVKGGAVFLLTPGQMHSWELSNDVDGYVFFHTKEFYDNTFIGKKINDFPFFYLQENYPLIQLGEQEINEIEYQFKSIYKEYNKNDNLFSKLQSLVDVLYISLSRCFEITNNLPNNDFKLLKIRELQRLIDQNYISKKSANDYANMMNVSTRHLSRLVNETLNKSTSDLIFERIMLEAKRLLLNNFPNVSEVAQQLGYEDISYFIRVFRLKNGISPMEFQKNKSLPK
jgi:AraC family transcriptional activator of pobA